MPSIYLQTADYTTYGLPASTNESAVVQASAAIDAYLDRQEGLLWSPDGNGNPCYMSGLIPNYTLTVTSGAITPGNAINVTVTGAYQAVQLGSVLILDRANPSLTEAVIVSSVDVTGKILTLASVQFSHDADALLEFNMTIVEERDMPYNRAEIVLAKSPIANIITGQGQLGYQRRGNSIKNPTYGYYLVIPPIAQFGGPPNWLTFIIQSSSVDPNTGRMWVPASVYLSYYTQVRIYYVAGWTYASLPAQIKSACASIAKNISSQPLPGNYRTVKQGDTTVTKYGNTFIDGDSMQMLNPYKTREHV